MFQKVNKLLVAGMVIILTLAACAPAATGQDERLGTLEAKVDTLSGLDSDLASLQEELISLAGNQADVAALQSRLDDLQTRQDELAAQIDEIESGGHAAPEEHADDPFAVSVAQYFMDTAGFHGMADTISQTRQVDPAYLGTVNRVRKVFASTPWPAALSEQGQAFRSLLDQFAAALEEDNGEQAAILSEQVHDVQHDFSHAIDTWLGSAGEHAH